MVRIEVDALLENVFVLPPVRRTLLKALVPVDTPVIVCALLLLKVVVPLLWLKPLDVALLKLPPMVRVLYGAVTTPEVSSIVKFEVEAEDIPKSLAVESRKVTLLNALVPVATPEILWPAVYW